MLKCCTKSGMGLQLLAYTLVIKKATNAYDKNINQHYITFETDSSKIGINNRCRAWISLKIENYIVSLKDINRYIKLVVVELAHNVNMGEIQWKWCGDQGK